MVLAAIRNNRIIVPTSELNVDTELSSDGIFYLNKDECFGMIFNINDTWIYDSRVSGKTIILGELVKYECEENNNEKSEVYIFQKNDMFQIYHRNIKNHSIKLWALSDETISIDSSGSAKFGIQSIDDVYDFMKKCEIPNTYKIANIMVVNDNYATIQCTDNLTDCGDAKTIIITLGEDGINYKLESKQKTINLYEF